MVRNDTSVTDPTRARINQDLRPLSQKTLGMDVGFVFQLYFCQSRNVIAEFRLLQDRPESLSSIDIRKRGGRKKEKHEWNPSSPAQKFQVHVYRV